MLTNPTQNDKGAPDDDVLHLLSDAVPEIDTGILAQ